MKIHSILILLPILLNIATQIAKCSYSFNYSDNFLVSNNSNSILLNVNDSFDNKESIIAKNYGLPNVSGKGYGYHNGNYGFDMFKNLNDYDKEEDSAWSDTSFAPHIKYGQRPGTSMWKSLGWYRGSNSGRYGHAEKY